MKTKEIIKKSFSVEKIEDEIKGCDGSIIPAIIEGKKVYFKFLPKSFKERIEKEIEVVKTLKNNNCKVPNYFEVNGQAIFEDNDNIFYASYEVPGIPCTEKINFDVLKDIMIELVKMHKVLKGIPIEEKKESDLDRLKKFYKKNIFFFQEEQLSIFIEKILDEDYEEEEYSYIHADINFKNIFIENNHVTSFIDFTDLRIGYLEDDLGKLFQNILYLGLSDSELEELINIYENELGKKVNRKNLLLSVVFRMMYRYFGFVNNNEGNKKEYKEKTEKILQRLLGDKYDKRSCI